MSEALILSIVALVISIIALLASAVSIAWSFAILRREQCIERPREEQRSGSYTKRRYTREADTGRPAGEFQEKAPQLPPEAIAPKLATPPKPKGGFGTKSGNSKHDSDRKEEEDSNIGSSKDTEET